MQTKRILQIILVIGFCRYSTSADGLTNNLANPVKIMGGYSAMRGTNGHYVFINPSEFWNGVWKESGNGWRTQLRVYPQTNVTFINGIARPLSTNLMLRVEWGSPVKNSGGGYFMSPNGKFARFELKDIDGNVVSPNSDAGTNLLERVLKGIKSFRSFPDIPCELIYQTNLPAWASPITGSLVASFPKTTSTNMYPRIECSGDAGKFGGDIQGETIFVTNRPPVNIGLFRLDEVYSIINEGDYTLTIQPILYKHRSGTNILDRVDLPGVTTKVHLVPELNSTRQP